MLSFFLDYHTGLSLRLYFTRYLKIGRQGIDQLGSFFGCIFLLFPMKVATSHAHSPGGGGRDSHMKQMTDGDARRLA